MTDEQVQKLFSLIGTAISETREVRKILNEHTEILNEHTEILNEHTEILNEHTEILNKHSVKLEDHDAKLDLLINRTDDIANTVIFNDKRLTAVEKDVAEIRGGIH